jgi:hypothetical protein
MKKKMGETVRKYAIRKFSQGVFSVMIGSIFIYGTPQDSVTYADTLVNPISSLISRKQKKVKLEYIL